MSGSFKTRAVYGYNNPGIEDAEPTRALVVILEKAVAPKPKPIKSGDSEWVD